MPNYSSLKLSQGGGLISDIQKAVQRKNTATIIIGCGGTGKDALKQLKKSLFARVRQDDPKAPIPQYSHIRFLSIDTDTGNLKQSDFKDQAEKTASDKKMSYISNVTDLDSSTEFFDISCDNIQGKIDSYAQNAKNGIPNPGFEWIKVGRGDILSATAGAGGVRQVGRMLLLEKVNAFKDRLTNVINNAKKDLDSPKVQFLIFAGIGGGTGSGTFLDVCYLVQYVIKSMALKNTSTQALVFLPDVNISKIDNPLTQEYIRKNGYCAMRELDYCMNLVKSGNYWKQELGSANNEKFNTQPADIVTLISASNAQGAAFKDGYQYAMNVASDFAIDLICESGGFNFDSHKSNHGREVAAAASHGQYGGNYHYSILGAAAVEVPFRKIMTYLASAMYATKFDGLKSKKPTVNDYMTFKSHVGLSAGKGNQDPQLFKELCNGEQNFPYIAPEFNMYKEDFKDGKNAPLISSLDRALDGRHGKWEENVCNLTADLKSYKYDKKPSTSAVSVINRVYAWIVDMIVDLDKGPYYARELINGAEGQSLLSSLAGLREWSMRREGTAQKDYDVNEEKNVIPFRKKFVEKAGSTFGAKSRYEDYASSMVTHYALLDDTGHNENGRNIPGRQAVFRTMIDTITKQIKALGDQLDKLCDILDAFEDVFISNYNNLNSGEEFDYVDGSYVKELFKITDVEIRNEMDQTISALNGKAQFESMLTWLLNANEDWNDDNKIATGVSHILKNEFRTYSNRSLEVYLDKHYNTNGNMASLQKCIEQDLYPELKNRAQPMFWVSGWFDMSKVGKFGYISAPTSCAALVNAATNFSNTPEMVGYQVRQSAQEDRIQIQVFASGVPMYAYNGEELYKDEFFPYIGSGHGYSSHEADEDWSKELPFMTPGTKLRTGDPKNYDVAEALQKYNLFEKAMELNILTAGPYDGETRDEHLYLHYIDFDILYADLNKLKADLAANQINAETALLRVQKALEDVENQKTPPPTAEQFISGDKRSFVLTQIKAAWKIETECERGHHTEVRFDNFMRYRGFNVSTMEEVEKFEKYVECLHGFLAEVELKGNLSKKHKTFERSLFTGLFDFKDDIYEKISFTAINEYGTKNDPVMLSDSNDKFAVVGIYQAFLNFCNQSDELIENAKKRSDDIFAAGGNYIRESLMKIGSTVLNEKQIEYYNEIRQSQESWSDTEKSNVKKFVDSLLIQYKAVCNRFRIGKVDMEETPSVTSTPSQEASVSADAWDCSCGNKGIIGNFCNNCGAKKPEPIDVWDCSCGNKGITGNFCSNCGAKKPGQSLTWDCSCGNKGIIGNFCNNCGAKRN